jgi:hypothetical protein
MLGNHHVPQRHPHQVYIQTRSIPRCYTRAEARPATEPLDFDGGRVLLLLTVVTTVAAFWLAYRGWRF